MKIFLKFLFSFLLFSLSIDTYAKAMPHVANPFGPNVIIFDPSMDANTINSTILSIYNQQIYNDFGDQRYALIFMPGTYGSLTHVDVRAGFYTQVLGVGQTPDATIIQGAIRTQDRTDGSGATQSFWRGAENLAVIPTLGSLTAGSNIPLNQNVWACSQDCPLRRFHVMNGSLRLYDMGWSSGGFIANSIVDGTIYSGTQQQYLTRNTTFSNWSGSNWNMVFVGDVGAIPASSWPTPAYSVIPTTPVIQEKPFLQYSQCSNQFVVNVRALNKNVSGQDFAQAGTQIPLTSFYITSATDTAATINAALQSGKHILFTPGVYHLTDTIKVTNANTIILGLGFPTLVADKGVPALLINDVQGVQVAGLLIDGGQISAPTLLQVGQSTNTNTHTNPVFLYDISCRIGGPNNYLSKAASCITVNSNDVVLDNTWVWRADHGSNVGWTVNAANNGLIVNGNNVTAYNLQAEHFQQNSVLWNGNNGSVYEFQNEAPYDVPNQSAWLDGAANGFAQYKVASNVLTHTAIGMGVYSNFTNAVTLDTAISFPLNPGVAIAHTIGFWLAGNGSSAIKNMLNTSGCGVNKNSLQCNVALIGCQPPSNIVSSYTADKKQLTLTWTAPGNATVVSNYQVNNWLNAPVWKGASNTVLSFTDSSLPGTSGTFSYYVYSVCPTGLSTGVSYNAVIP